MISVLLKKERALELLLMPFILLQSMLFSPCSLVRTKFPNRVMNSLLANERKDSVRVDLSATSPPDNVSTPYTLDLVPRCILKQDVGATLAVARLAVARLQQHVGATLAVVRLLLTYLITYSRLLQRRHHESPASTCRLPTIDNLLSKEQPDQHYPCVSASPGIASTDDPYGCPG